MDAIGLVPMVNTFGNQKICHTRTFAALSNCRLRRQFDRAAKVHGSI